MTVLDLQVLPMKDSAREQELRASKGAALNAGSGLSSVAGHERGATRCPKVLCD